MKKPKAYYPSSKTVRNFDAIMFRLRRNKLARGLRLYELCWARVMQGVRLEAIKI